MYGAAISGGHVAHAGASLLHISIKVTAHHTLSLSLAYAHLLLLNSNVSFTQFSAVLKCVLNSLVHIDGYNGVLQLIFQYDVVSEFNTKQFLETVDGRLLIDECHLITVLRFGKVDFHL